MKLEEHVLPGDRELANKLIDWAVDCSARVTAHTYNLEFQEAEKWLKEFQRTINDLKYLKLKKSNLGRKIANGI